MSSTHFFIFIILFFSYLSLGAESINYSDISTTKKEKKIYPMGKKIFEKKCDAHIDFTNYKDIYELQNAVENKTVCKALKPKYIKAVTLYLWEVKRVQNSEQTTEVITVTKDEKCPVCGMFVYKYPKWVAQIFYKENHLSFDGVKDLMKYYFEYNEGIQKILVTDYYTQKTIDAKKAYYVIGSDIYGPMGEELIPFANENDAKTFYMDHKGKTVVQFHNIKPVQVKTLDE